MEKKEQTKGLVIAIGPGKTNDKGERIAIGVKVGDKVLFNKPWSEDKKMKEGSKELFLVDEEDILAIIEWWLKAPIFKLQITKRFGIWGL